jgi:catechol 2,3-dioxygenase-like lactoylglutathione lyase family enzyme
VITGLAGVLVWTAPDRWAAMDRFYVDVLGLRPRTRRDGFVNVEFGAQRLTITTHDGVHGASLDPLRIMVNLEVDDIQAEHARLAALGVEFTRPPEREPWGGRVATLADPDGNTLQLFQLPPAG